jgi:hypothetical protein
MANQKIDPDYRNINKPLRNPKAVVKTPTAKDSIDYKAGFDDAVAGKTRLFPNAMRQKGYAEGKARNAQTPLKMYSPAKKLTSAAMKKFPAKTVVKKMATMPKKRG